MTTKFQLQAERRHAVGGWLDGGDGSPRWDGDDGRALSLLDILIMRVVLLEGGLDPAIAAKYQTIVAAQQANFDALDSEYEAEKGKAGL